MTVWGKLFVRESKKLVEGSLLLLKCLLKIDSASIHNFLKRNLFIDKTNINAGEIAELCGRIQKLHL